MYRRLLSFVERWVRRFAGGAAATSYVTSTGAPVDVTPRYSVDSSMSSMARFPWVWTCVRAVSGDLAGLPLVALRRGPAGMAARDGQREPVDDPILDLLENPSVGITGRLFRKQLWVDFLLTGNAYIWRASELELIQLHPAHVRPRAVGVSQLVVGYSVWDGARWKTLPADAIVHIRDVSWSHTIDRVLGESAIRPLHDDLTMEAAAKEQAAEQAAKGRPDVMFSVDGALGPKGADEIEARWERSIKRRSGAFAYGRGVKAEQLGWSPKEFEYAERSGTIRDVILAVFEVTPARAGLATANYGTDRQQARTYWGSLQRRAAIFDDAFSSLAGPGVRIEHDFKDVEALQVSQTERQARVLAWISMGMSPRRAAQIEGFHDAAQWLPDESTTDKPTPRPIDRPAEEPQGDRRTMAGELQIAVCTYLASSAHRYAELAEAAAAGTDTTILARWETERLFGAIDTVLHDPSTARWWADDIVQQTIEAVRMSPPGVEPTDLAAFSGERATRIATAISARRAA